MNIITRRCLYYFYMIRFGGREFCLQYRLRPLL